MDLLNKMKEIISSQLSLDKNIEISNDTRLKEDLNIDSLSAAELILTVEDELNITIDDELILSAKTVGDIIEGINK